MDINEMIKEIEFYDNGKMHKNYFKLKLNIFAKYYKTNDERVDTTRALSKKLKISQSAVSANLIKLNIDNIIKPVNLAGCNRGLYYVVEKDMEHVKKYLRAYFIHKNKTSKDNLTKKA